MSLEVGNATRHSMAQSGIQHHIQVVVAGVVVIEAVFELIVLIVFGLLVFLCWPTSTMTTLSMTTLRSTLTYHTCMSFLVTHDMTYTRMCRHTGVPTCDRENHGMACAVRRAGGIRSPRRSMAPLAPGHFRLTATRLSRTCPRRACEKGGSAPGIAARLLGFLRVEMPESR